MSLPRAAAVAVLSAALLAPAAAARAASVHVETSLGGLLSQPLGPLGGTSRAAPGLWLGLSVRRDSTPWLAARTELGFVSHPVGGAIDLRAPDGAPSSSAARITDRVAWLTAGPQLERAFGRALGYLWVTAGLGRTEVHASLSSSGGDGYYPETFDDPPSGVTFAWTAGAGWRTAVRPGLDLDLAASFVNLGRAPLAGDPPLEWTRTQRERIVTQSPDPKPSLIGLRLGFTYWPGRPERGSRTPAAPRPSPSRPR
jgi:hypothetical protein